MTNVNRLTNGFYGLILFIGAALFLGCEKVPDYCGRYQPYEPKHQFCFEGKPQNKCSDADEYNPLVEGCDPDNYNVLSTRCAGGGFAQAGNPCNGYSLSTAVAPANAGTVDGSEFVTGGPVTLVATAAPGSGYTFAGWAGASAVKTNMVTLTMDRNQSIVAMFNPPSGVTEHTLAAVAFTPNGTTGGAVYINGVPAEEITIQNHNTPITAMAVAAVGYTFTGWSGALEGSKEPTDVFTMNGGKTLVAEFTPNTYKFTVNANPLVGGVVFVNGTASMGGIEDYSHGTAVTLRIQPAEGYTFTGWTGAVTGTANPLTVTMNSGYHLQTLTANFAPGIWTPPDEPKITYGTLNDTRDGQSYRTVKIGELTWMAQNLNYTTANSWCYDNADSNCVKYGRLYTWDAALSACQMGSGWRLPNDSDWDNLINAAGGNSVGTKLKSQTGWTIYSDISSTDEFEFSALPGGSGDGGSFYGAGDFGYWWSAAEYGADYARIRYMGYVSDLVSWAVNDKTHHLSVRCVKDENP